MKRPLKYKFVLYLFQSHTYRAGFYISYSIQWSVLQLTWRANRIMHSMDENGHRKCEVISRNQLYMCDLSIVTHIHVYTYTPNLE